MAEREAAKQPKILSFSCARPTVAEIDLGALVANYHALRALARGAEFVAVVKADAYGHGAVEVSHALAAEGCRHFGVATLGEAKELRAAGLEERIYVMGGFFAQEAPELVELDIVPFVGDAAALPVLDSTAAPNGAAFPIHLKLDTGASRLGITAADLPDAIETLKHCRHLTVEGVCTLLASAADPSSPVTQAQLGTFAQGVEMLRQAGFDPRYLHVANSAATVLRADAHFNMIRVGLALYGLPPVPAVIDTVKLTPAMTFKTRLLQVKRVAAGVGVSYGHTFVTARPSVIGVLPVGYADGYRRGLQNGGEVLIRGRRAPVVGAVCMDLTMVELTDVPEATAGDPVVLWGGSGEDAISANDVAHRVATISYELLCTVGRRVPRVYRN
ncbi:MAG TPA: alanine racemase [Candidatus Binataceae bacterium]|jgi:alanine racemase|nr:alanine racemase [Candidatus Binataceae bacterium]